MSKGKKVSQTDVAPLINQKQPFQASTLRGVPGQAGTGRMSDDEVRSYRQSLHPFYGYGFSTTEYPNKVNPGK